ncbi:MAG: hypothetical protein JNM77_04150 [Pseudonocardia sp.]|nr:hypothetical protein [Pseudonocardia sp.]
MVVPADPVVGAGDRSADTDRPASALPQVTATIAAGGKAVGAALGPRAARAVEATIAAVVGRAAAGATIGEPAATGASTVGTTVVATDAATTDVATTDVATTDVATTDPGTTVAATTGGSQGTRAPTAVTAIRGGRTGRTVARSVTTAVDPVIATAPVTTAERERVPGPVRDTAGTTEETEAGTDRITARVTPEHAVERAPRAIPPPTAVNTAMIEAPSGPTSAADTTTAETDTGRTIADTGEGTAADRTTGPASAADTTTVETDTGRTIADTGEGTAADRTTGRAIGSADTARPTQAGTGRVHHAGTTGTTGRGAAPWTATDRRDTGHPIGRRHTGRTIAEPGARAAAPPPATAPAVTVGGSTATGRAGTGTATSGAADTAVRTRRTAARKAEAGPATGTRPGGTTGATVRRRTVPTIAVLAALTAARQGATMPGALAVPPRRVVDPATAVTGSGAIRGASSGPPAPSTTVERRTGPATDPPAPRSVARPSAGPVTRLRAGTAATPTRSGSRRRRSPTT